MKETITFNSISIFIYIYICSSIKKKINLNDNSKIHTLLSVLEVNC